MIKSIAKILISPRRAEIPTPPTDSRLTILGNGPSLNETLDKSRPMLDESPLMAVNFFANSPVFFDLKPEYYALADPHFFNRHDDPNVSRLMENLSRVDWPMTLFIPFGARPKFSSEKITVKRFPLKAAEGPKWFRHTIFTLRLGMPRPRNVLIPSIMIGLWMGFREICICGADHTWIRTLSVNEHNEVVSIQPHFYKEDDRELERQRIDYLHIPLHRILESQAIAFRAYHTLQTYAAARGLNIYNATPGSFIDAFPRKDL